jgi:hypothetical protein
MNLEYMTITNTTEETANSFQAYSRLWFLLPQAVVSDSIHAW